MLKPHLVHEVPLPINDVAFRARHGLDEIFGSAKIMPRLPEPIDVAVDQALAEAKLLALGDTFLNLALHSMGIERACLHSDDINLGRS